MELLIIIIMLWIMQELNMRELMMRINTDLPPGEGLGFLGPQAGPPNPLIF